MVVRPRSVKARLVLVGIVAAVGAAALALGLSARGGGSAAQRETAMKPINGPITRLSERGLYAATIASLLDPVRINTLHAWTMHLQTAEGQPVDEARIGIKVVWPHTGKPMQTRPHVTGRGSGDYLIEGVKLQMTGMWRISFDIAAAQGRDTLSYDLGVDDVGEAALDVKLFPTVVRRSERGLYRTTISRAVDPVPINQIHEWYLRVETAAGKPVEGARITVDGDMPAHGHGLPTKPKVLSSGDGNYTVYGMKFQMPGRWQLVFTIRAGGKSDVVVHDFLIG